MQGSGFSCEGQMKPHTARSTEITDCTNIVPVNINPSFKPVMTQKYKKLFCEACFISAFKLMNYQGKRADIFREDVVKTISWLAINDDSDWSINRAHQSHFWPTVIHQSRASECWGMIEANWLSQSPSAGSVGGINLSGRAVLPVNPQAF